MEQAVQQWRRIWDRGKSVGGEPNRTRQTLYHSRNTKRKTNSITQTTISFINEQEPDVELYGDSISKKEKGVLRLLLQNVSNVPEEKTHYKSRQLVETLTNLDVDIMFLNEVGLIWDKLPPHQQWHDRTESKIKTLALFNWNTKDIKSNSCHQPGGTGIIATNDTIHRIVERGGDPSGLGRWTWILLEGKQRHRLRLLTAYRPVESRGADSVNQQHWREFTKIGRDADPRTAILEDLFSLLSRWKEQGDSIIVGMDANEDVRNGSVHDMFQTLDMREVILEKHRTTSPPATYNRNFQRKPIDGVWASLSINPLSSGYLPFGDAAPSDHRALWIDITYVEAYGYNVQRLNPPKPRKLTMKNPKMIDSFNSQFRDQLTRNGLIEALSSLIHQASVSGWTPVLEQEFNRIHGEQEAIRLNIENSLRKLRMGNIPWSPSLQQARDNIYLWSLLLKKSKGVQVSNRLIRRTIKKVSPTSEANLFHLSENEIIESLKDAYKDYKAASNEAQPRRERFLESLARTRATRLNLRYEAELKRLLNIERQKTTARTVKRMRHRLEKSATIKVFATENGIRTIVTEKEKIEEVCINENISRFSQSYGTPPLREPLLSELGIWGDGPAVEAILQGTYEPPDDIDNFTRKLLKEMKMPEAIRNRDIVHPVVTSQIQQDAWKKQKEMTSASSSSPSFSHYKATSNDAILCEFDANLRSLPAQYGFSPSSWQRITDVEILKKAGVYDIEKMRTITLMHAEFNMNNKQLGRDVMRNAEAARTIAPEQYGSRKNRRAIIAALNKRLTMDLLRMRKQAAALQSTDFKSCYDRMAHNMTSISLRRQGASKLAVRSMFKTLSTASHSIRTAYGDSDRSYSAWRSPIPLQGLGQGNGAGPAAWALLSTPIIAMMKNSGFGLSLASGISKTPLNFVCYAFVDDTDIIHTARHIDTPGEDILEEVQSCVDHWEGGSAATGAAMQAKDKSYWYLIDFEWNGKDWRYRTIADMPGELDVREYTGERVTLSRLEPNEARETLGVYIAMDGNCKRQILALREKAVQYNSHITRGFLNPGEAWYALKSTIMKTLEYPMETISLTKRQWNHILAPILTANLPKAGISRTFTRDVIFGPSDELGLNLMHPYHHQFLRQLSVVLEEMQAETITKSLLVATAEQLLIETGLPGTLKDIPTSIVKHILPDSWWLQLLSYLQDHNIELDGPISTLGTQTSHDVFIMKAFIDHGFRKSELKMLNDTRLYLRVYVLSQITTMDGSQIEEWAWEAVPAHTDKTDIEWPRRQPSLSRSHRELWRRALIKCFHVREARRIDANIGQWPDSLREKAEWYYEHISSRLFHREQENFRIFRAIPTRTLRLKSIPFVASPETVTSVDNATPCSVVTRQDRIRITGIAVLAPPPVSTVFTPSTIHEWLEKLPAHEKWPVEVLHEDNITTLLEDIRQGTAHAVSDGSYKDMIGTSAFILRGKDRNNRVYGVNKVPGEPEDQSAYRSELAGVLAVLTVISAVCETYHITDGYVLVGLDGAEALKQSSGDWPLSPKQSCFDLLKAIRRKRCNIPISLGWEWIEGHQDDEVQFCDLPGRAQDNVLMDNLAKAFLDSQIQEKWRPSSCILDEGWYIKIQGKKASHFNLRKLYNWAWNGTTKNYWANKFRWNPQTISAIDWEILGKAFGDLKLNDQRRTVKLATGLLGVGHHLSKFNLQPLNCPRCDSAEETNEHVLLCPDSRATTQWRDSITSLRRSLESNDTDPEIITAIIEGLNSWKFGYPSPPPREPIVRSAWSSQNAIGWWAMVNGFVSCEWHKAQRNFFKLSNARDPFGRPKDVRRWTVELVRKLLGISWDMWRHRNGVLHSNELTAQRSRELLAINNEIRIQFETGANTLSSQDRFWISRASLNKVLEYDLDRKKRWLESVRLARQRFQNRKDSLWETYRPQRELLRNWLHLPRETRQSANPGTHHHSY
jgi:hypothetical protein